MTVHLKRHLLLGVFMLFACIFFSMLALPLTVLAQLVGTATSEETDAIINSAAEDAVFAQPVSIDPAGAEAARRAGQTAAEDAAFAQPVSIDETNAQNAQDAGENAALIGKMSEAKTEGFLYNTALGIGGMVVGIGGRMFDAAVSELVLKMGDWFISGGVGGVVDVLWSTIRDLFNVLFIFALVFIGLKTILNSNDSGTQKSIGLLIAAALLINFSLYISKVILDIANFTAVTIYEQASKGITGTFGFEGSLLSWLGGEGSISGAYMHVLAISTWFNTKVGDGVVTYAILAMFFLIILGLVLAYGAIMLTVRFVAIIILLIFSPVMFLGWILPGMKSYSTKWFKMFVAYCFFAPAYIFMLYLGLYTLAQLSNTLAPEGSSYSEIFAPGTAGNTSFTIFLFYAIGLAFLFAATKVAGIASDAGAGSFMTMGDKFAKRVTTGAGAVAGGYMASSGVGSLAKWQGGRMDDRDEASTKAPSRLRRSIRNTIKSGESAKFGSRTSFKDRGDADKKSKTEHARSNQVHKLKSALGEGDDAQKQQAFADMSNAQLVEIAKSGDGKKLVLENAALLSASQMKAISDSEDINDAVTASIGEKRSTAIAQKVTDGSLKVKDATKDQLGALGVQKLTEPDNAFALSEDKIKSLDMIDVYKDQLRAARAKVIRQVAQGNTNADDVGSITKADLLKAKSGDIAQYPAEALLEMADELSTDTLTKIVTNGTQSTEIQRKMRNTIEGTIAAAPGSATARAYQDFLTNTPAGKTFGK